MKFVKMKDEESVNRALKEEKNRDTIFSVETPFIPGVTPVPEKVARANETLSKVKFNDPILRSLTKQGE